MAETVSPEQGLQTPGPAREPFQTPTPPKEEGASAGSGAQAAGGATANPPPPPPAPKARPAQAIITSAERVDLEYKQLLRKLGGASLGKVTQDYVAKLLDKIKTSVDTKNLHAYVNDRPLYDSLVAAEIVTKDAGRFIQHYHSATGAASTKALQDSLQALLSVISELEAQSIDIDKEVVGEAFISRTRFTPCGPGPSSGD